MSNEQTEALPEGMVPWDGDPNREFGSYARPPHDYDGGPVLHRVGWIRETADFRERLTLWHHGPVGRWDSDSDIIAYTPKRSTPSPAPSDTLGEWASLDDAVGAAIAEHADWHAAAFPSARRCEPRVLVKDGDTMKLRRPFKSRGHWRVRWQGVARIVSPKRIDGNIVFLADWS